MEKWRKVHAVRGRLGNRRERQLRDEARHERDQGRDAVLRLLRVVAVLLAEIAELTIDLFARRGGSCADRIGRQRA